MGKRERDTVATIHAPDRSLIFKRTKKGFGRLGLNGREGKGVVDTNSDLPWK